MSCKAKVISYKDGYAVRDVCLVSAEVRSMHSMCESLEDDNDGDTAGGGVGGNIFDLQCWGTEHLYVSR
jgi:hypothetical protein